MQVYHKFILITMLILELPKLPYILGAFWSGKYYLVPQVGEILGMSPSKSPIIWILIHWIIGNVTLGHAIAYFNGTPNGAAEMTFRILHFSLTCTIALNVTTFGTLPLVNACLVNLPFIIFLSYVCLSTSTKKWLRELDIYVLSIPVLTDVAYFIYYTIQEEKPEILIFYILLNYLALN